MLRTSASALAGTVLVALSLSAQSPSPLDPAVVARVREEATTRSKVHDHVWWLSEVYGPRVTGTPAFAQASDWAMQQFTAWGLASVHQERWAFGQGWTIERFSATLTAPQPAVLIGAPRNFSPSTAGAIGSDVVHVKAERESDLTAYRGKLRGKIVIMQPVRAVRMLEGPIILRMDDGPWWSEAATPQEPAPVAEPPAGAAAAAQARQQFAQVVQKFLVDEGVGVLLERGSDDDTFAGGSDLNWRTQRTDGGTVFPTSGGSRDPKVPAQVPSATLAAEHYNRLVRLIERGVPVRMEVEIKTTFHPEGAEPNGINTIAEIPGTDLGHEVVIMGAHMDGVPYATGATDNATGTAAMMEAVRVIQALKLRPRRTIRVALWGGEEQGLLGSRAYVAAHFWDADARRPKPDHASVAAYFNLDNGTGRIRGVWGQANKGALPILEKWGEPLKDLGWKMASPRSVGSTDHVAFDQVGIPGFQFIQERLEYNSRSHHSNMDTFDRVQKADAEQQGAVAAVFAWQAANWPEKLPRKPMAPR
ncbi:MAG: M20/M25/M40 family metallo-hydrolase [Acidobacteria bacterium]|nr:M20/M25/M40 family metallo-hydrolase [Acidobacteriota bacterium]